MDSSTIELTTRKSLGGTASDMDILQNKQFRFEGLLFLNDNWNDPNGIPNEGLFQQKVVTCHFGLRTCDVIQPCPHLAGDARLRM